MKKVREIKQIAPPAKAQKKLHVAAYCRVSTDSDAQLESLDVQRSHYESLIASRVDWELVDVYYDEGISGTKASIRPGLMRMMEDCENHRIDMVLTKSLSRFARNTTDCLELVRRLQALEIPIYFEKENLNTAKMESEFFLSTYSSIAESESVSISENTKWSVQKQFQNGTYKIGCAPYGYVQVDGKLKIDPEQGEIVREIFAGYLSGVGISEIVRSLNERGITTKRQKHWQASTVVGILTNITYTGNVIFQKTYTDGQFNRHANHGQREQYYIKDHHKALVSQEDFDRAAQLLNQHSSEKGIQKGSGKYQKRYAFSGRILCGECGGVLKRRIHSCEDGPYVAWCCSTHLKDKTECSMKFIRGDDLERAFAELPAVVRLYYLSGGQPDHLLAGLAGGEIPRSNCFLYNIVTHSLSPPFPLWPFQPAVFPARWQRAPGPPAGSGQGPVPAVRLPGAVRSPAPALPAQRESRWSSCSA
ncbi:MAG: recombinase family protein [Clostridiales bacterium]|nr:recombinase family protein [Clostridiales bacterium]